MFPHGRRGCGLWGQGEALPLRWVWRADVKTSQGTGKPGERGRDRTTGSALGGRKSHRPGRQAAQNKPAQGRPTVAGEGPEAACGPREVIKESQRYVSRLR